MAHSAVGNYTSRGNRPFPVARCPLADTCDVDFPVRKVSYCPSLSGNAFLYGPKRSETIRLSETGVVRSVARCRGTVRPPETGGVRSVAYQEAGGNRSHDLFSPSASKEGMDELCLASKEGMDEPCLASKEGMDEPCLASKEGMDEPCLASKEGMDEPCLDSKEGMDEPCLASQEGMDEPCLASKEGMDEPCLDSTEGMDEPCLTLFDFR